MDNLIQQSGLQNRPWRQFIMKWMAIHLLFIMAAAYFSYGYHHPDEHFQIIEFASYKLGKTPAKDLAWEYGAQLRPWMQPGLYVGMVKGLQAVGVQSPFVHAFFFRLLGGLLGFLGACLLALCCFRWFTEPRDRAIAVRAIALLWFLPYLYVRTSSESLAASCMVITLGLLSLGLRTKDTHTRTSDISPWLLFGCGLLMGFAFQFRYQVGFMVLGTGLWLLLIARISLPKWLLMTLGICLPTLLGVFVDYWGYGNWTFTPWTYLHQNIFQGVSKDFGISPWWAYVHLIAAHPLFLLAWILLLATLMTWVRYPKHILTWTTVPFVLIHVLTSHKEARFLFPVAVFTPIFLVLAFSMHHRLRTLAAWFWHRRASKLAKGLYGLNLIGLLFLCMYPNRPDLVLQKYFYNHFDEDARIHYIGVKPYTRGYKTLFYQSPHISLSEIKTYDSLLKLLDKASSPLYVSDSHIDFPDTMQVLQDRCEALIRPYPRWVKHFNVNNWMSRHYFFNFYRCQPMIRQASPPH